MSFQGSVNQALGTVAGMKTASKLATQKSAKDAATTAVNRQLQNLSTRVEEMEKAKANKQKTRKWLDVVLGGAQNG